MDHIREIYNSQQTEANSYRPSFELQIPRMKANTKASSRELLQILADLVTQIVKLSHHRLSTLDRCLKQVLTIQRHHYTHQMAAQVYYIMKRTCHHKNCR